MMDAAKSRRAMFAACRQLGLSEDDRRAMLRAVAGVESSAHLTPLGWAKVLDHLNRLSGHAQSGGQPARWRPGCEAQGRKIAALLAAQKLPWRYLTHGAGGKPSMCKRMAGVDRLEFADAQGLAAIIAALSRRQEKQAHACPPEGMPTP